MMQDVANQFAAALGRITQLSPPQKASHSSNTIPPAPQPPYKRREIETSTPASRGLAPERQISSVLMEDGEIPQASTIRGSLADPSPTEAPVLMNRETLGSNTGEADQYNTKSQLVPIQNMSTNNNNNSSRNHNSDNTNVSNDNNRCQRTEEDIYIEFLPLEPAESCDEWVLPTV